MEYKLKLPGKEIPLYFGTWSISRFCELNGNLSVTAMQNLFGQDFSIKHILSLLLCGAEAYARKNKIEFNYTDIDAADWLDEIGGIMSDEATRLGNAMARSVNPSYQGMEVLKEKKEPGKKKQSVGLSSESTVSEPA